jgi:hypothetical protein
MISFAELIILMLQYFFKKRTIRITYGITACDETEKVRILLDTLIPLIDTDDEIVVLQDVTTRDEPLSALLKSYSNVVSVESYLNGDFSAFKNQLLTIAKGTHLFQIDADETLPETLIKGLKDQLRKKPGADCFYVPRVNIITDFTEEFQKNPDLVMDTSNNNRINFPDYQPRIVKLSSATKWKNKVHEEFTTFKKRGLLPAKNEDFALSISRALKFRKNKVIYTTGYRV